MRPWWEWFEGRLEHELRLLADAGIAAEVDAEAKRKGYVRIAGEVPVDGEPLRFIASFPDVYPYTRFEVAAPTLSLSRHQHAFSKNLCLIGRRTTNWHTTDTLAEFLTRRLPRLLHTVQCADPREVAELEERQGEPYSDYYPYVSPAILLVDSSWQLSPDVRSGSLQLGFAEPLDELRAAVLCVNSNTGSELAKTQDTIASLYKKKIVNGRWIRVDAPIPEGDPSQFLKVLIQQNSRLRKPQWRRVGRMEVDIIGVVFPEETQWRKQRDGWVFVVRRRLKYKGRSREEAFFIRAGRSGPTDLAARTPAPYRAITGARIAVIGLGCVGAPSAIEFARLGVSELLLVDADFVDPAIVCRWPLGLRIAGQNKVDAISQFVRAHYPWTKCVSQRRQIGRVLEGTESDLALLNQIMACDLIYDATAETGISHLLADVARDHEHAFVAISTTPGGWGGRVLRIRPRQTTGCWTCFQHHVNDGAIPVPPSDPEGEIQPEGCADPTYIAASVETAEISLAGVRLAAFTLEALANDQIHDYDWDVGILSMRHEDGQPTVPTWKTFPLNQHPACEANH